MRTPSRTPYHVAMFLLLCLFGLLMVHARSASIVFDEGPHLAVGYVTLRTGDLRLQPVHIHPPLANLLAAAPLLLQSDLPDPRSVEGWDIGSLSALTDALVWQYPHPERLALAGRFPIILMTMLLGALVFRWAGDLFGPRAGLLALFLCACDPNVIAHGSLITTDMAVVLWGTAALWLTSRYLRHAEWGGWAGASIALGLALASKVSAISLLPVVGLLWLLGPRAYGWRRRLLATVGGLVLAALVLWAVYGFELRPLEGFPFPVPAATHIAVYRALQQHYALGHPAFLLGQNSERGWWAYFPAAFLLKTPPATLLLLAASVIVATGRIGSLTDWPSGRSLISRLPSSLHRWGPSLLFPLLYAASTPFSSVNIGYRHLLPILPFLFILASSVANLQLADHASRITRHILHFAFCALLACHLAGALRIAPDFLAYFNLLAGGPAGGHRALVDSNLDWGQNLWQLRDWMREHNVERVAYAHFSPARPQVYGVQADFLPPDPRAGAFAPFDPAPGVYAIGATVLQGVYTPGVNTYAWFRAHEPAARLGYALFIYEVPARSEPAWAAICADLTPTLSPAKVQTGFGLSDMRTILLDCAQAWIYPAGGEPGGYLLPVDVEPPPGATFEFQARTASGEPLYTVYRAAGEAAAPEQVIDVSVDGPLAFLGYQASQDVAHPGDGVELWGFWQVVGETDRPLSLMAHLVGADGIPIAIGDGLGMPVEQWRRGDVLVQRHRLLVPAQAAAGTYRLVTGAYWLDTMERWRIGDEEGILSDQVVLTAMEVLE